MYNFHRPRPRMAADPRLADIESAPHWCSNICFPVQCFCCRLLLIVSGTVLPHASTSRCWCQSGGFVCVTCGRGFRGGFLRPANVLPLPNLCVRPSSNQLYTSSLTACDAFLSTFVVAVRFVVVMTPEMCYLLLNSYYPKIFLVGTTSS